MWVAGAARDCRRKVRSKEGWSEESEWQFDLKNGHAALTFTTDKGKFYKSGRIDPGRKNGQFKFTGVSADGKTKDEMVGEIENKGCSDVRHSTIPNAGEGRPARLVFSVVAKGNRLLIDLPEKDPPASRYSTFCEVSYTRKGSGFGQTSQRP